MIDVSQFKDIYIMEVEEHIQKLNDNILKAEKIYTDQNNQDELKKLLNELMRSSHTIKGSSASMGYTKLAFLTHVMEDIFDGARNDCLALGSSIIDKTYEAIDWIEKSVSAIKSGNAELDTDIFANELKALAGVETEGFGKSVKKDQFKTRQGEKVFAEKKPVVDVLSVDEAENVEVAKIDYIKVPVERLEILMDSVEELLIERMHLERFAVQNVLIKEVSDHINLLVSNIRFQVMQARLVPVSQIFGRFSRMIRDLAKKQNKEVEFKIIGSEIELDRTIVDKLGEPLVHLLRNAVDHGINKTGNITLKAVRENDKACFIVENDDQSIDFEKVRSAAIKRGIISAEEAVRFSVEQLIELLFHPRLSTREVVSEISGRGVGLSVVKNFVEALNGRVLVENINPGVRVTLELPLTLAIINALLIQINDSVFAIPFANVERSVCVDQKNIKYLADREVAIVYGMNIPLVRFSSIFKENPSASSGQVPSASSGQVPSASSGQVPSASSGQVSLIKSASKVAEDFCCKNNGNGGVMAVIIKRDEERIGIVVDKLIDVQEIIIKPLSPIVKDIKSFSGSTILGDGRVVLILDALNMIQSIEN